MGRYFVLVAAAASILAGCSKKAVEPTKDDLMSAVTACASGGCKDFQKVSCGPAGDPDGLNSVGEFKCTISYALASGGPAKTQEACFISEAGKWKQKDGPCL